MPTFRIGFGIDPSGQAVAKVLNAAQNPWDMDAAGNLEAGAIFYTILVSVPEVKERVIAVAVPSVTPDGASAGLE